MKQLASASHEDQTEWLGLSKPAPPLPDLVPQCDPCGSTFIQKLFVSYRCGQCGSQFGAPVYVFSESQRMPSWRV